MDNVNDAILLIIIMIIIIRRRLTNYSHTYAVLTAHLGEVLPAEHRFRSVHIVLVDIICKAGKYN